MRYYTELMPKHYGEECNTSEYRMKCITSCSLIGTQYIKDIEKEIISLDRNDMQEATAALKMLLKYSQQGKPFNLFLNKKIVHEAFEKRLCHKTQKNIQIWRFRKGSIRIYFCYDEDKLVLLTGILAKRSSKLTPKEENQLFEAASNYYQGKKCKDIKWIEEI